MAQSVPAAVATAVRRRTHLRWCLTVLGLLLFLGGYSSAFLRDWPVKVWTTMFAPSARRLMAGEQLYRHTDVDMYVYPPSIAMQSIPLALLPSFAGVIAWYLVSVAALGVTVWCAWHLAGLRGWSRQNATILTGALVLGGRFLLSPLENHQFDAVIAAMLMLGFVALQRRQENPSAMWLGTAASMKCTPWLIGPYLWGRGQRMAAVVFALTAICWNVVPDLVFPRTPQVSHLEDWHREVLDRASHTAPGQWIHGGQAQPLNQSLGGLVHRASTLGVSWFPNSPTAARLNEPGPRRWLGLGLSAVLVGVCWLSLRRKNLMPAQAVSFPSLYLPASEEPRQRMKQVAQATHPRQGFHSEQNLPESQEPRQRMKQVAQATHPRQGFRSEQSLPVTDSEPRVGLEASMVLCLMLLFSPQSSKSHYVVMILPMLVLVHAAWQTRNWRLQGVLAGLLFLGPLSVKDVLGLKWGYAALIAGVPTWFVLLSLAGLWQAARLNVAWQPGDALDISEEVPKEADSVPNRRAA